MAKVLIKEGLRTDWCSTNLTEALGALMTTWNRRLQAAARIDTHAPAESALGAPPDDLHPDDRIAVDALLSLARGRSAFATSLLVRQNGETEPSQRLLISCDGGNVGLHALEVGVAVDTQPDTDPLTGLPSRSSFLAEVDAALRATERNGRVVAVLYIDIDDFKAVNDASGFDLGDDVLRRLGSELRATTRPADHVARISGDEFAILCADLYAPSEARDLAERMRVTVSRADLGQQLPHGLTASIGVAIGNHNDEADTMLGDADTALQQAKVHGRDRWELFTPSLRNRSDRRLAIAARLHEVLESDGIDLAYQPIVEIETGELVATEALIRDHLVAGAMVTPRELIAAADDVGLIRRVEASVLRNSVRRLGEWNREGVDTESILHVNITRHRLTDREFPLMITQSLAASGLDGGRLCLEISTASLIEAGSEVTDRIEEIRSLGVAIALDEFESSAAAIRLLARLTVDKVKLDRRLVAMLPDPGAVTMVRSTIQALDGRDIVAVAVGVETEQQRSILHDVGCSQAQGYLFSPPVPDDKMEPIFRRRIPA